MQGARVLASLNKLLTLAAPRPKTDEINELYRQQKYFHYDIVLCWVMEMKNSSYRAKNRAVLCCLHLRHSSRHPYQDQ